MRLWQVWVRYQGRNRPGKVGAPMPQVQAMAKVAELNSDPRVKDAWLEEEG